MGTKIIQPKLKKISGVCCKFR